VVALAGSPNAFAFRRRSAAVWFLLCFLNGGPRLQRGLERFHGLRAVVLLEKQHAPCRVNHGIVRRKCVRVAEEAVRILKAAQYARCSAKPQQIGWGVVGTAGEDYLERSHALRTASKMKLQQPELERGVSGGRSASEPCQQLLCLSVPSAGDVRAGAQDS
jgi:hypothetical protein